MIITLGGTKGGVAKTTTAVNIAAELQSRGVTVALYDMDPEGQAALWSQIREANGNVPIPCFSTDYKSTDYKIEQETERILDVAEEFDAVIIDVAGRASAEQLRAMAISDLLILPTRPGIYEMNSLQNMVETFESVYSTNPEIDVKVLITQAPTHLGDTRGPEFAAVLEQIFDNMEVINQRIGFRVAYADAASQGLAITEVGKPKDSREFRRAFNEIFTNYFAQSQR